MLARAAVKLRSSDQKGGFPLTVVVGFLVGIVFFPGSDPWLVALVAAALVATDAALANTVIEDARVPHDLRTAINIESGLNDGLATPLVLFFITAAAATEAGHRVLPTLVEPAGEMVTAAARGIALGGGAGWWLRRSRVRYLSHGAAQRVAYLALAVLTYEVGHVLHGNGFVAVFAAGLVARAGARLVVNTRTDPRRNAVP